MAETPITDLGEVNESRLTWPQHKPRAAHRIDSPFRTEVVKAQSEIEHELARWRIRRYIVSRNNQRIFAGDPGAAVWWDQPAKKHGDPPVLKVIACDRYNTLAANLHAIALTLKALRDIERWGAYTTAEATEGAKVLSLPPPDGPPWWETLGVDRGWPIEAVEMAYRAKAEKAHPDRGGSVDQMAALNVAIAAARRERSGATS